MGKVFDWDKAASLIKQCGCTEAEAGLMEDWFWTAVDILEDGKPECSDYGWLESRWATPVLKIGDTYHECYKNTDEAPEWNAHTMWPESALKILNEEE